MKRDIAALLATVALAACTVGPDYRAPQLPVPDAFDAPTFAAPADEAALASWWRQFSDPVLDDLVNRALRQNIGIEVAASRLRQARFAQAAVGSAGLPAIGVSAGANNTRFSKNAGLASLGSLFGGQGAGSGSGSGGGVALPGDSVSTFSVGFDASWEIDLFGGARRTREAAAADAESAEWLARDAQVSLIAEVADAYLRLRAVQRDAELLEQQRVCLQILQQIATGLADQGLTPGSERFVTDQRIAAVAAALAANHSQQDSLRRQIALLLAIPVTALPDALAAPPAGPTVEMPPIAPGLPADVLRRRPDIRAAERALAGATARIGVEVASLYPRVSLTGIAELLSTGLANLVSGDSVETIVNGAVSFPVLDFGRRGALVGAARERADEAYLTYRQTVITALSEVGDALEQSARERERQAALDTALAAARKAQASAEAAKAAGLTNAVPVIEAEIARIDAARLVLGSQALQAESAVRLFKALGGGWQDAAH